MDKDRKIAILVGVLIITAYSLIGTNNPNAKMLGMILEIISGLAVLAIAFLMSPYLKPYGATLSLYYLWLKGLEGILMIIAGVLFYIHSPAFLSLRDNIYLVHGYIFAIPALLFYILLYRSKLIPGWLSIWGMVAAVILIIVNLLEAAKIIPTMIEVLYLPIVLNEAVLALWLIFKGFNPAAIKSVS